MKKICVVAEHQNGRIRPSGLRSLRFARELVAKDGGGFFLLLLGCDLAAAAADGARFADVVTADDGRLEPAVADRLAPVIAGVVRSKGADCLVAASSGWAKDIIGRAGGLLGGAMAGDVVSHRWVDGDLQLKRPVFAGSLIATVVLEGAPKVITIRPSAWAAAEPLETPGSIRAFDLSSIDLPEATRQEGVCGKRGGRPDAVDARIVVSGGRAFRSAEDFEAKVGGLADQLGAAVGCSRAVVDEGIAPNELQIGQTGKVVAPDLYLALGLSGAIQHLAGMNNSKVIVAINRDREAPIFSMADFGLIGDVHEVVPELMAKLAKGS